MYAHFKSNYCQLDYDRLHFCDKPKQLKYFEQQLVLVDKTGLPLFLHCRNSSADFFGKPQLFTWTYPLVSTINKKLLFQKCKKMIVVEWGWCNQALCSCCQTSTQTLSGVPNLLTLFEHRYSQEEQECPPFWWCGKAISLTHYDNNYYQVHSFTGSWDDAKTALDFGLHIGINGWLVIPSQPPSLSTIVLILLATVLDYCGIIAH